MENCNIYIKKLKLDSSLKVKRSFKKIFFFHPIWISSWNTWDVCQFKRCFSTPDLFAICHKTQLERLYTHQFCVSMAAAMLVSVTNLIIMIFFFFSELINIYHRGTGLDHGIINLTLSVTTFTNSFPIIKLLSQGNYILPWCSSQNRTTNTNQSNYRGKEQMHMQRVNEMKNQPTNQTNKQTKKLQ